VLRKRILDSAGWVQDRDLWLGEVRFAGLKATTESGPLMFKSGCSPYTYSVAVTR